MNNKIFDNKLFDNSANTNNEFYSKNEFNTINFKLPIFYIEEKHNINENVKVDLEINKKDNNIDISFFICFLNL